MSCFIMTKLDKIRVYDSFTLKKVDEIIIELLPSVTREPNEIIGFRINQLQNKLVIITGKNLVRNE